MTHEQQTELEDRIEAMLAARLDPLAKDVEKLAVLVEGNGHPERGLIVRLDRLEQNESRRNWWVKASLAASISALVGVLVKSLKLFV
jgi:hypothetical protein